MKGKNMDGIVCAIRGGPQSTPTIDLAIDLAIRTNHTLHFLFVVNLDFLTRTSTSRVHTISEDMEQLGELILLKAQETAAAEGVDAKGVVRHGRVREEIIKLSNELGAGYVVLGLPQVQEGIASFDLEMFDKFSESIADETDAKVILSKEEFP
jgi:nucleotide-binding universal stress UspA family protein